MSSLQNERIRYQPQLPPVLKALNQVEWFSEKTVKLDQGPIAELFPKTWDQPLLRARMGSQRKANSLRVGVVLSGGQAAGGHNVIIGLFDALTQLHVDSILFGFLRGPQGILSGCYQKLEKSHLQPYRNQGGFDLIGSGRTKIETPEQLAQAKATVDEMQLDALVIIGGDDSNTNAALLAEYFLVQGSKTRVLGVPKTIDGDLQNEYVAIPFGFDSACRVYSEIIGNIARDALSAQKYYHFIRLMGRSASHIALECALATHPNYVMIGEEIQLEQKTLRQLTQEIADLICERALKGKEYGVILIPEGAIEFIPEMGLLIQELNLLLAQNESISLDQVLEKLTSPSRLCFSALPEGIQRQLLLNRDPHGNVQVSFIETERLFMQTVGALLEDRRKQGGYQGAFNPVAHFLGYEGRAGFPSNFDCNYCYVLGYTAALLAYEGVTGYMCFVENLSAPVAEWQVGGAPITALMHFEMRKGKRKPVIKKTLVDLKGRSFQALKQSREEWRIQDDYQYPGPLQFYGEKGVIESFPLILK